ncbi:hypothetical protein RHSIM_Rhsim05G0124900 [Rhododendron simsii]|uniref:Uncharacterized protein n=1 Tax=Rhododendron simsii TaxID=118357 RepID=A0A834LM08_RHOSS|nr:hypothetical protein RHSIM_Rhsim05G0124900 [Rhododendron simsii]
MIRLSGFAWNHETNSIRVDSEDVWKEYEKFNPKVNGMNGKAFPMYESWQILFGIDRATGDFAEDAAELDNCDPFQSPNPDDIPNMDEYLEECNAPRFANGFVGSFGGGSWLVLLMVTGQAMMMNKVVLVLSLGWFVGNFVGGLWLVSLLDWYSFGAGFG